MTKNIYRGVLDEEGGNYVTSGQAAETEQNDGTETLVQPYEWNWMNLWMNLTKERQR